MFKILLEQTDEQHPISVEEINKLKALGIEAERKIYDDIKALTDFGWIFSISAKNLRNYVYCVILLGAKCC